MADIPESEFILVPDDVAQVRFCLLRYLPAELANIIIEEAEYWPKLVYNFRPSGELLVSASRSQDHTATACCVMSEKMPSEEYGMPMKIVKVRFKIEAHDQGWCSENNFPSRYQGSWTWFEAVIIRNVTVDQSEEPIEDDNIIREALEVRQRKAIQDPSGSYIVDVKAPKPWLFGLLQTLETTSVNLATVKNPNTYSDSWDIQRNARADAQPAVYEIIWTRNSDDSVEEEKHFNETGSKLGRGFIDALQGGDRIAVLARAQFPGWMNCVNEVQLEIYFSV